MTLRETFANDLKDAQKAGDAERVLVLRFLSSQLHNKEIEKRGQGKDPSLTDEEVVDVFRKEVKKRKESIELFRKGNREDLANREEAQLAYVVAYVPALLDAAAVSTAVQEIIDSGITETNAVMKEAMQRFKGKADGKMVAEIVKEKTK